MAFARIITHSQICSRELALVLLARGYTVEIVSPDKVPDNFADLELRVEAGAANELVANVEAHNRESTTSLEFVHNLKAPIVNLPQRPSELGEAAHPSGTPVSFHTGPCVEDMALSVGDPQRFPRAVPPAVETPRHREANPEIDSGEGTSLVTPKVAPPAKAPLGPFAVEDAAAPQPARVQRTMIARTLGQRIMAPQTMVPPTPARWLWRAGPAFASLVLLGVVLGLGVRDTGKTAAPSSDTLPVESTVPTGVKPSSVIPVEKDSAKDPGQISTVPWVQRAQDFEADSDGRKQSQVTKSGTPARSPSAAVSRRHGDDLIARDTTIYFGKRFEPAPKNKKEAKPID
jgi:hypothetical protein